MGAAEAMLPSPPARERRVLPAAAVVLVLVAVVLGGYATTGALTSDSGPSVDVGGVVRVTPLSGWELAARSPDQPFARLTRGSATLDVVAVAFAGTRERLLAEYVAGALEPEAEQLSVSEVETIALASGIRASRLSYVGTFGEVPTPIEGQVTALVSGSGSAVVFDGWAPFGLLQYALDDVETMIERAEVA
jgi:hypothetical protein